MRSRIDWKFALALELEDTGFDFSVLSEFRTRLADGEAGRVVFDAVLEAADGAGLLKTAGRQRTDSTHVLAATHALNRLELVVETLRAALNEIAQASGDWLAVHARSDWFDRYTSRPEDRRFPTRWAARIEHGDEAGTDGSALLTALWSPSAPPGLRALPQVELLRRVWVQQFQHVDGCVQWREPKNLPPPGSVTAPPTTWTPAPGQRPTGPGTDSRCTSPKPANPTPRTWLRTSRPLSRRCPTWR
ncbi:transposase [Streptomyces sp. NPDC005989]|uniref:transposase n=1 Tax=unclassified Streptomyces TaxID=2593676 RepID=UPI0033FFD152